MTNLVPYSPPVTLKGGSRRPPHVRRPDAFLMQVLGAFRPSYYTAIGLVPGRFVKFERLRNGEIGAIYETAYYDPTIPKHRVVGYLWCVGDKDGRPRQLVPGPLYDR